MKKEILIAFICASLILVTPFAVLAQENKISSNLTDKPDVEGLVAQLRVVINEILLEYGHIPIVRSLCNTILDSLGLIGKIIYCIFLLILMIPIGLIVAAILAIVGVIPQPLGMYLFALAWTYDDNCPPSTPLNKLLPPLKSISTLKDIEDIKNLVNECPCMQQ